MTIEDKQAQEDLERFKNDLSYLLENKNCLKFFSEEIKNVYIDEDKNKSYDVMFTYDIIDDVQVDDFTKFSEIMVFTKNGKVEFHLSVPFAE